ncbi:hypothetical protein VNO77_00776 [Canavalia gladiata]|uniref:Disease resistance protein At4g27190-like leucine-rich repeats domain-containing protein n=1 Tax=Canavalia gladiata TaxID=3824 RepID=A0AAN9R4P7_CANGL
MVSWLSITNQLKLVAWEGVFLAFVCSFVEVVDMSMLEQSMQMTSILTDCAKDIVGRVINLIVDESRNVCCFKCIVDDFEKEKPELEAKWRSISKDIEDTKRRADEIRDDVIHWEVEAKKLIDEDTKTKVSCFGGWCPNCIWRYKRGKQLTQLTNDVRTLKATNFPCVGRSPHLLDAEIHSSQANGDIQSIQLSDKSRKALGKKEKKVKYLFCDDLEVRDMDVFPRWFDASQLEILIIGMEVTDSVKVSDAFFEKMTRLRVLLLQNNKMSWFTLTLQISVRSLSNIRSLSLIDWNLGSISILGILQTLENLHLSGCSISELPNEITELEKLRQLQLEYCRIERNNPFEVIGRCSQLEELFFSNNKFSVLDNANEVEAIHRIPTFPILNRYHLEKDDEMDDSVSKIVCLPNIDALVSEATFKYLVQGAEILQLSEIVGEWRNLIPEIVPMEDNGMNDLIELSLMFCSKVKCLVNTKHSDCGVPNVFSKLVSLNLEDMDNLEDLCIGPLPLEFLKSLERLNLGVCVTLQGMLFKGKLNLCNLKIMQVGGCPILTSLFQPSTARSLVLLEELRIWKCEELANIITDGCGEMKYIFGGWEQEEDEVIVGSLQETHPSQECYRHTSSSRNGSKGKQQNSTNSKIFPWLCICRYHKKYGSKLRSVTNVKMPTGSIPGQVIVDMRDDEECKNCISIFSKLKKIIIMNCDKLKYVIGPNRPENHNHEYHMDFPALEELILGFLPNMINICPKNYFVTLPSLKKFRLDDKCSQISSDSDLVVSLYSGQLINTTNKDTGEIGKHFLTLESLCIKDSKVEMRCLPELEVLEIIECKELKKIIEEDVENDKVSPQPCFPKLVALVVRQCHKLKCFIASNDLPNLELLIINGASKLEELTGCEQRQGNDEIRRVQAMFPKLEAVIFMNLSSLCLEDGTLQTIRHRVVHNCPKLSLTSTTSLMEFKSNVFCGNYLEDLQIDCDMIKMLGRGTQEVTTDYLVEPETQRGSGSKLPSPQTNEESKEEFVGKVASLEIPVMATSPIDSESKTAETASPSASDNSPYRTQSQELTDEPSLMKKQKILRDTKSNSEIPQGIIKRGVEEGTRTTSYDTESYAVEWDPIPKTTSQPSATSESELHSSQVNDANQSIVGNFFGTVHERKSAPHLQSLEEKSSSICSPNLTESNEATVDECVLEVSNLTNKEGEIGGISADNIIVTQRYEEEPKKEFIGRASISEMPAIAASTKDSDMVKGSSPSLSNIPLPNIHSNESVDGQLRGESCLTNQQKLLGESSAKRGVEERATSENAKMETLSIHLKLASSQPGPSVDPQCKSYPNSEIRLGQFEAFINKENEGHPINIEELRDDDLISLFQLEEEDSDSQMGTTSVSGVSADHPVTKDNLVVNVLADMEKSLKMPLKDIASSEANSLRLLTALNFLSRLSSEHVTLSEGLKVIIDSLRKEFPSILCSFKQAFATTNKFALLDEKEKSIKEELTHRKEAATALVSKISKAKYFMDEAQQKEAMLKEQMNRLEKEMKDCEADLSFLQEEKKKFVAETMGYKKEFETVRNDKSQMMEDQRNAWQKLSEIDYKWSVLCSQFENNRITASNPS